MIPVLNTILDSVVDTVRNIVVFIITIHKLFVITNIIKTINTKKKLHIHNVYM